MHAEENASYLNSEHIKLVSESEKLEYTFFSGLDWHALDNIPAMYKKIWTYKASNPSVSFP